MTRDNAGAEGHNETPQVDSATAQRRAQERRALKILLFHFPLLVTLSIAFVASTDLALFRGLKTEDTYGWWVVVLMPIGAVMALTQVVLWLAWLTGRIHRNNR